MGCPRARTIAAFGLVLTGCAAPPPLMPGMVPVIPDHHERTRFLPGDFMAQAQGLAVWNLAHEGPSVGGQIGADVSLPRRNHFLAFEGGAVGSVSRQGTNSQAGRVGWRWRRPTGLLAVFTGRRGSTFGAGVGVNRLHYRTPNPRTDPLGRLDGNEGGTSGYGFSIDYEYSRHIRYRALDLGLAIRPAYSYNAAAPMALWFPAALSIGTHWESHHSRMRWTLSLSAIGAAALTPTENDFAALGGTALGGAMVGFHGAFLR